MYISSPAKKLTISNFMAAPLVGRSLLGNWFGIIPTALSIIFCTMALFEIIHIIWNHFNFNQDWD